MIRIAALTAAIAFTPLQSQADVKPQFTVENARTICKTFYEDGPFDSGQGYYDSGYCKGFFVGFSVVMMANCLTPNYSGPMAINNPPSSKAMVHAFMKWSDENPKHWGDHFSYWLPQILTDAFPCEPT